METATRPRSRTRTLEEIDADLIGLRREPETAANRARSDELLEERFAVQTKKQGRQSAPGESGGEDVTLS